VPELAACRVVEARHADGVCMLIGYEEGRYWRLEFKFDSGYRRYTCRVVEDPENLDLNFVVLAGGVAVSIPEDRRIELFHRDPRRPEIRRIRAPEADAAMRLCREEGRLLFFRRRTLYHATLSDPAAPGVPAAGTNRGHRR
jgi:hypothetical protein